MPITADLYTNPITFADDFRAAYTNNPGYRSKANGKENAELCYKTYMNSRKSSLGFLVAGRIVKFDSNGRPVQMAAGDMIGLTELERTNFGRTNQASDGSVLDSDKWSFAMNDCWVLGNIHACRDFYLASPKTAEYLIDPKYGMTVTGRELLGILSFGYKEVQNAHSPGLVCADPSKARNASLPAYQRLVEQNENGGWKRIVGI